MIVQTSAVWFAEAGMLCALKRYCLIPSGTGGNAQVNFEPPRARVGESMLTHLNFLLGLCKRVTLLAMAVRPDLPGKSSRQCGETQSTKTGSRTNILVHPEEGESFEGPPGRRERTKHSGDNVAAREARDEVDQSRRAGRRDANEPVFVLSRESAARTRNAVDDNGSRTYI